MIYIPTQRRKCKKWCKGRLKVLQNSSKRRIIQKYPIVIKISYFNGNPVMYTYYFVGFWSALSYFL